MSNRLPVTITKRKEIYSFTPSIGGLATGLRSVQKSFESIWIGWPGNIVEGEQDYVREHLIKKFNCYPVFIPPADIDRYYAGFSNRTLWPLFHYFPNYTIYDGSYWGVYKRVNELFCEEVLKVAKSDDIIWVHDYHLMLLPKLIRERLPDIGIGFFLHIPFPSYEIFRLLPWRYEILEGMTYADLVGFHTYDYAQHFLDSVYRILGYNHEMGEIIAGERLVKVDVFPMGIDYEKYSKAASLPSVRRNIKLFKQRLGDAKIILSVDRLDYTKGIPQRLEVFGQFLERYPQWRGKVILILITAPSRINIEHYRQLKIQVDELVGKINGEYSRVDWIPIQYFHKAMSFSVLTALYTIADVLLVTPLRDGMNLIAKEYIATRQDGKGMLILSEMAGAASELGEALVVNPFDKLGVVEALNLALSMSDEEKARRNRIMQERLMRWNVNVWAEKFVEELLKAKEKQRKFFTSRLQGVEKKQIVEDYKLAKRKLFLLDYDGTLIGFYKRPERAKPSKELISLIEQLALVDGNEVVIISGRDRKTLEEWFGNLKVHLVAEHGAWIKEYGKEFEMIKPLSLDSKWKETIRPILELYVDRTPGAFIEEKEFALVFHYRGSQPNLGDLRARELVSSLLNLIANLPLKVSEGNKIVEVRNVEVDKGKTALHWLSQGSWDFILAMGDDQTDEDLFAVLPEKAYSIKIGLKPSRARFNLSSYKEALDLLRELLKASISSSGSDISF